MLDLKDARDWFCELNKIPNDVEIYRTSEVSILDIFKMTGHYDFLKETKLGMENLTKFDLELVYEDVSGVHFGSVHGWSGETKRFIILNCPNHMEQRVLMHELVHHRQDCRKELVTSVASGVVEKFWKGKWFCPSTLYKCRPWEIEAELEEGIWSYEYHLKREMGNRITIGQF